jgi:antitoxin CptB
MTSVTESQEIHLKRLFWQCRRGMSEVEMFLNPFLQQHYVQASAQQQQDFEFLLTQQDTDLFSWLMENATPLDVRVRRAVEMVIASRR